MQFTRRSFGCMSPIHVTYIDLKSYFVGRWCTLCGAWSPPFLLWSHMNYCISVFMKQQYSFFMGLTHLLQKLALNVINWEGQRKWNQWNQGVVPSRPCSLGLAWICCFLQYTICRKLVGYLTFGVLSCRSRVYFWQFLKTRQIIS